MWRRKTPASPASMGLSGNLESFGVPEILQLIGLQQKSGVLKLTNEDGEQQVLFLEKGRIVATRDRRDKGEDPLVTFLRSAHYLNDKQIEQIATIHAQTGRDALYVIVSGGMIGKDRLVEAVTQYTQKIVDNLLGWERGTYEFSGDEGSIPKLSFKVPLSVEELLMEGVRRMDELATIKQAVLAPDLYLVRSPDPIDRSSLSRELLVVLDNVRDSTAVERVVARSPLGEYSTYEAISTLLEAGHLVVDPCPPARTEEEIVIPRPQLRERRRAGVGPLALLVMSFGTSLMLRLLLSPALHGHSRGLLPAEVEAARYRADQILAGEVYRATTGQTGSPETLVEENYLRRSPIR